MHIKRINLNSIYVCCVNITVKQTLISPQTNSKNNLSKTLRFPGWSLAPLQVTTPGKGER